MGQLSHWVTVTEHTSPKAYREPWDEGNPDRPLENIQVVRRQSGTLESDSLGSNPRMGVV